MTTPTPKAQLTAQDKLIRELEAKLLPLILTALDRVAEAFTKKVLADAAPLDDGDMQQISNLWSLQGKKLVDALTDVYDSAGSSALRRFAPGTSRSLTEALRESYILNAENRMKDIGDALYAEAKSALAEGNVLGESYDELRTRLKETFAESGKELGEARAERIARTEVQSAVNKGTIDGVRSSGENAPQFKVWMCVTPGTRVSAAEPLEIVERRRGSGLMTTISTASGRVLSITPNHPVLTLDGWTEASALHPGDQVICHNDLVETLEDDVPPGTNTRAAATERIDPDIIHTPSKVDEIYRSATNIASGARMMMTVDDLDSDPIECEVDVIPLNSELRCTLQTPVRQLFSKFVLECSDVRLNHLLACGNLCTSGRRDLTPGVCSGDLGVPVGLLGRVHERRLLSDATNDDARCEQVSSDDCSAVPDSSCDLSECESFSVERSHLANVFMRRDRQLCGGAQAASGTSLLDGVRISAEAKPRRISNTPDRCACILESVSDRPDANSIRSSQLPKSLTGLVATDEIIDVKLEVWPPTSVYDLTTSNGWFMAEGIIVHNSTIDTRTREAHFAADGQVVALDQPFVVDGEELDYPGDPNGSGDNVINCRCSFVVQDNTDVGSDSGRQYLSDDEIANVIADFEERGIVRDRDAEEIAAAAVNVDPDGEPHTGAMIALVPSDADLDRLVLETGEPRDQLHLTLMFLGETADIDDETRNVLRDKIAGSASMYGGPVEATAFAAAMFNPDGESPCWVLQVGGEPLVDLLDNAQLDVMAAQSIGTWEAPEQHQPFCAHITLAYTDDSTLIEEVTTRVGPITFDRLRLALGDEVVDYPFGSAATVESDDEGADVTNALTADASATHELAETNAYSVLRQRFMGLALECPSIRQDGGWTDMDGGDVVNVVETILGEGFDVNRTENAAGWRAWFATNDAGVMAWTELDTDGSWSILVGGPDRNTVVRLTSAFKKALPGAVNTNDGQIAVQFWAMGPMGPVNYGRRLAASSWDDVGVNYGTKLSKDLDGLMKMSPPEDGGRLMVWHGPPGTGKTHALRALAHEWRNWCDVDYIIDADAFFEHASYMVSALVMNETVDERWRLVVIEDAGRYLLANAQEKIGEGLGRLLNLADGLVGQGLRQMILMTTNEPAEELHAAVTRPGRCLSNLRFGPLSRNDANAWLKAHESKPTAKGPATLAELYATIGTETIEASFVPAGGIMAIKDLIASETVTEPYLKFSTARIRALTLLDIPAFTEAVVAPSGEVDADGFMPFTGVATVEDTPTGDGRIYLSNCFRWEDGGVPFRWDVEDDGAHLGSVLIGKVDAFERDGNLIRVTGRVDTNLPWGSVAAVAMERGMISGVSVDMDDIPKDSVEVDESAELMAAASGDSELPLADEDQAWDPELASANILALATDEEGTVNVDLVSRGHLFVPDGADTGDPANYQLPFADVIDGILTAVPAGIDWAASAATDLDLDEDRLAELMAILDPYYERMVDDDEDVEIVDEELEASAWSEFGNLPPLPAAAFAEPSLRLEDEHLHFENGRIYGWVAQNGVCHDAFSGSCVTAPLDQVDLRTFLRQPLTLDDGSVVQVGAFTMGAGHDNDGAETNGMKALFDDTRTVAGIVTVGVNKHGMWFSGVAAPWLSDWDKHVFAACRPSGHWRRLRSGGWSLRAVLSVPSPGFPNRVSRIAASAVINRSNMALAASAASTLDEVSLVEEIEITDPRFVKLVASAIVDEMELRQRIRAEVDELSESLNDVRHDVVASMTLA